MYFLISSTYKLFKFLIMKVTHIKGKFSVMTPNGESELLYINKDNAYIRIYRTFTPERDAENGVAERLTIAAFSFARKNRLKVRPDCPFIITFLEKNKRFKKQLTKDNSFRGSSL